MPILYLTEGPYWARLCDNYLYLLEHYDWYREDCRVLRAEYATNRYCHGQVWVCPRIYGGRDYLFRSLYQRVQRVERRSFHIHQ